ERSVRAHGTGGRNRNPRRFTGARHPVERPSEERRGPFDEDVLEPGLEGELSGESLQDTFPERTVSGPELDHTQGCAVGQRRRHGTDPFCDGPTEERACMGGGIEIPLASERRILARVESGAVGVQRDIHEAVERDEPVGIRGTSQQLPNSPSTCFVLRRSPSGRFGHRTVVQPMYPRSSRGAGPDGVAPSVECASASWIFWAIRSTSCALASSAVKSISTCRTFASTLRT